MLKKLHPDVQAVLDAKNSRLLIWAHPLEHGQIKASLEQIQAPALPDAQQRFEIYPLHGIDTAGVVAQLQPLAPKATIIVNASTKPAKLVVWGLPSDHQRLEEGPGKTATAGDLEHTDQLEVYSLVKADPTTVRALLQSLVPDAKISVDPQTKKLVALAVPDDQKAVKAVAGSTRSR